MDAEDYRPKLVNGGEPSDPRDSVYPSKMVSFDFPYSNKLTLIFFMYFTGSFQVGFCSYYVHNICISITYVN